MRESSDSILGSLISLAHEKMGLSPNQISTAGLVAGIAAGAAVVADWMVSAMVLLAVSQILDGLDGGVARRYGLQTERGRLLETVYDRICEAAFFLALAVAGLATYQTAALAMTAILLITWLEPISKFDPGFKRFMMYFGFVLHEFFGLPGFEIALSVVFFANLAGFALGTIIADYRFQQEVDAQAIRRREFEIASGVQRRPGDPPSFLSKLLS
jgi:phosphatidylglycerophosphate synthase